MPRARLLFLLIVVLGLISAGLLRAQDLPDPVEAVLRLIEQIEHRTIGRSQLLNYSYHEVLGDIYEGCLTSESLQTRYYVVTIDTDQLQRYTYRITTDNSQIVACSIEPILPTPTPTIDFTRTTATPTLTPTVTETPRWGAPRCEGFLYSRLRTNEQGRVLFGGVPNSLRQQPESNSLELVTIPSGAMFDVLEGPQCDAAGRAWWRVRYLRIEGWTAEGEGENYYVEPVIVPGSSFLTYTQMARNTATPTNSPTLTSTVTWTPQPTSTPRPTSCPGSPAPRLMLDGYGRVTPGEPNNLRERPSTSAPVVAIMPAGATFRVLDNLPQCDEAGRAWWLVDYQGERGFTVEGIGSSYFVEPINEEEAN